MKTKHSPLYFVILSMSLFWGLNNTTSARSEDNICSKPKFSIFKPGDRAEVSPGSKFSFRAPDDIAPHSVITTVKGIEVEMEIEDRNDFYYFNGTLPAELVNTYARVKVTGKHRLGCKGTTGWLIKIKEN